MKDIQNEIVINASLSKVWDLLINPKLTPEYMYTCAIETDFTIGGNVLWRGIHDKVVYVSGTLIELNPEKRMKYTVIDPNAAYDNIPENHLTVSYELSEEEGGVRLSVVQSGYEHVAEGKSRYDDSIAGGGWQGVIEKIKEMAEQ